jgi:hypothetical protein
MQKKGSLFHFDITPLMVNTHDGYRYAVVFVEDRTRLLHVEPMKDKTAESVVAAIANLRLMVDSSGDGRKLEELRGDFDCALTVNGRGEHIDTEVLKRYKEQHPLKTTHSSPHTQAQNQAEPMMGTLFAQMNVNLVRAGLDFIAWWDMLSAAADQLNTHAKPGDSSQRSRYQHYWGRKPDLSKWIAFPGQWVYVKVDGTKANRGDVLSEPGIFIKPARSSGGFIVRLFRTWKATHCYDVRATDDQRLRLARLIENDALNNQHADVDIPQAVRSEQLRALFRKDPLNHSPDFTLAVIDRFTQLPIKLIPALDENGQVAMLPESRVRDTEEADTEAWARWTEAQTTVRTRRMKKTMFQSLPLSLPIRFDATVSRRRDAKFRWEKYRKAKTLGHLQRLNPGNKFYSDFTSDLAHSYVSARGLHYDSNSSTYTYSPPPPTLPTPATAPPAIPTPTPTSTPAAPTPTPVPTPPPTPLPIPAPSPTPVTAPPSPPPRVKFTAAQVDALPDSTPVRFLNYNPKMSGSKSAARWALYSKAAKVGELKLLNPKMFKGDFTHDLTKCLMFVEGVAYDYITKTYSLPASSSSSPSLSTTTSPSSSVSFSSAPCCVFTIASSTDLPNQWLDEDIDIPAVTASSPSCSPSNIDLVTALNADYLKPPGASSGLCASLQQVEEVVHSQELTNLQKLSAMDKTLHDLLQLEQLEGQISPPEVSNASAEHMATEMFAIQDMMEGFVSADFTASTAAARDEVGDANAVFTAKRGNAEHPLLRQALMSDDKDKWEDALEKDVRLMEKHGAIKLVSRSRHRDLVKRYGRHMVDIKHFVHDCKVKRNAKGEITKYKVRGCVGDATRFGKVDGTYSATVAPSSRKLLAQLLALHPNAASAQNDVQGAYYCGKPTPYDEGGRILFCRVPEEFERFGYSRYDENGEENLIEIVGNIPGRQEAGVIWGAEYTRFLTQNCNLVQSEVDRRMFYRHDDSGGMIIVAVYVDDSWYISTSSELEKDFVDKWSSEYSAASDSSATAGEFCGVVIEREADGAVVMRGDRLFDDLAGLLVGHEPPRGFTTEYPMSANALKSLHAEVDDKDNPALGDDYKSLARSVVGLGGFIACNLRPDSYFAYVAITHRLSHHFTLNVWKAVLRWAHYLVNSKDCCLTYRPHCDFSWCCHSDSSLASLANGSTFGGVTFGIDAVSGLVDWRCMVPRSFSDSSVAAELVIATYAAKSILGYRMLLHELRMLPDGPTPLYLDANAVINGAEMEKITKQMRFMAARYSMLRKVITDGKVTLAKVASDANKADIFTKPLVGDAFIHARALVLGHCTS